MPTEPWITGASDTAWSVGTVLFPWYLYQRYGDVRVLARQYDTMTRWLAMVATTAVDYLVVNPTRTWGDDWLAIVSTPGPLFRTGYYYYAARIVSEAAAVLGNTADQQTYAALAQQIASALNSAYLVPPGETTNLAEFQPVTALDSIEASGWGVANLVDGITTSTAASEGYHSAYGPTTTPPKWVQVDLGSAKAVQQVVLYPADPTNYSPNTPGFGFPVRYEVQVSDDPTFATGVTTVVDNTGADQPNPGNTPQSFTFTPVTGRYVRVTATKLYQIASGPETGDYNFALAELEVNPGQSNPIPAYYGNNSQYSNAFPLYLGIVPEANQSDVLTSLVNDIVACGYHMSTGIQGTGVVPWVLAANGYADVLQNVLDATAYPSYGYMLSNGPGTIWESWDGDFSNGSRDHPALGSVGQVLYEQFAGIHPDPAAPGYKKSLIAPQPPSGLEHAAAHITTPYGQLASAWSQGQGSFVLHVTVPANTTATVVVPGSASQVQIRESGTLVWDDGTGHHGDHVTSLGVRGNGVAFAVDAGTYHFVAAAD